MFLDSPFFSWSRTRVDQKRNLLGIFKVEVKQQPLFFEGGCGKKQSAMDAQILPADSSFSSLFPPPWSVFRSNCQVNWPIAAPGPWSEEGQQPSLILLCGPTPAVGTGELPDSLADSTGPHKGLFSGFSLILQLLLSDPTSLVLPTVV